MFLCYKTWVLIFLNKLFNFKIKNLNIVMTHRTNIDNSLTFARLRIVQFTI
jgi:hypothetical protein